MTGLRTLSLPLTEGSIISGLESHELVLLSGTIYAARDMAHARLAALINAGQPLPIPLQGQAIYYMGPSPTPPGMVAGSAGPTTSSRMDKFTPLLLEKGLKVMIGKGERSNDVKNAIAQHGALYLGSIGGAGAYLGQCITSMRCVAFDDLGPEAIYELTVKDFPAFVM
jgi:fumarate hydratase subunit beta